MFQKKNELYFMELPGVYVKDGIIRYLKLISSNQK